MPRATRIMRGLELSGYPVMERCERHGKPSTDFHGRDFASLNHAANGPGRDAPELFGGFLETEKKRQGHAAFPKVRRFHIPSRMKSFKSCSTWPLAWPRRARCSSSLG